MNEVVSAGVERGLVTVSRRASIFGMAAASMLSTLANPPSAGVKKKRKGTRSARVKCQRQVEKCRPAVDLQCETVNDQPEAIALCKESFVPCCDLLATCDLFAAMTCLFPIPGEGEELAKPERLI